MRCATVGCEAEATGKSKYCTPHKREARAAWLAKVQESSAAREVRQDAHAALWQTALEAGRKAHADALPTPMNVFEANVDGSPKAGGNSYYVSEGACGFGSVIITPANCSFALWLKKNARVYKSYYGGLSFSTNFNGSQSIERAEAAALAIANVLREGGVKAYPSSRLD